MKCRRAPARPAFTFKSDGLCKRCWGEVPPWMQDSHRSYRRRARQIEKDEARGYVANWMTYEAVATQWAKLWAQIRMRIGVEPEFVAGLHETLEELRLW